MIRKIFFAITGLMICASLARAQAPTVWYVGKQNGTGWLAVKELQRYLYVRTGNMPAVHVLKPGQALPPYSILVGSKAALGKAYTAPAVKDSDDYRLYSLGKERLLIQGASTTSTLYGVYTFLESTGIGFALDGDVLPGDTLAKINLDGFDHVYHASFALRGIQPFHDFAEGPDWWEEADYKAIIAQLPKLRMNFIGFHTYPYKIFRGWDKPEPLVWIGTKDQFNPDGSVKQAYAAMHANTGDSTWDYMPVKTSQFHNGASQLFEADVYGAGYMKNISPWPHTPQENVQVFDSVGRMLGRSFSLARRLGIKTCLGTETPLSVPPDVTHANVQDDAVKQSLYAGIFSRIMATHPLDYYWCWTPEGWTWEGENAGDVTATKKDLLAAVKAARQVKAPFTLATCGWVLGPASDRAAFDNLLPKDMPFAVINRQQGYTPVEPAFDRLHGRPKWEISWLEDDPALTSPQFWAGRVFKDALDAYKYGCTGFMGIHWRTRNLGPALMAVSRVTWDAPQYNRHVPDSVRDYPVDDLYRDWCLQQFGTAVAGKAAAIFTAIDGAPLYVPGKNAITAHFPRASDWGDRGPGVIRINYSPWDSVKMDYAFVEDLAALQTQVKGVLQKERYDYWLNNFRYAATMGQLGCVLGEMDKLSQAIKENQETSARQSLGQTLAGKRVQAATLWNRMETYLLQAVNTTGEMGTVANLEEHSLESRQLLNRFDSVLQAATGKPLPPLALDQHYTGQSRIVMPTRRTTLNAGEDLQMKLRVLCKDAVSGGTLHWKALGSNASYAAVAIARDARNVFDVQLPGTSISGKDFEYYVTVQTATGEQLRYPAAGSQTVLIW